MGNKLSVQSREELIKASSVKPRQHANMEYREIPYLSISDANSFYGGEEYFVNNRSGYKDEEVFRFGTAFHHYVYEQEFFEKNYEIYPKVDRRTKKGKELAKHLPKHYVFEEEYEIIKKLAEYYKIAFRRICKANHIKEHVTLLEQELYLNFGKTYNNIQAKCKLDCIILSEDATIIVDIKTTGKDFKEFTNHSVPVYGYLTQARFYKECLGKVIGDTDVTYYIVCLKKIPPTGCQIFKINFRQLPPDNFEFTVQNYAAYLQGKEEPFIHRLDE